tara:strand:- start:1107 stop:1262 length:156 start_codon:yes stop_codon:yes gene_type:complete
MRININQPAPSLACKPASSSSVTLFQSLHSIQSILEANELLENRSVAFFAG